MWLLPSLGRPDGLRRLIDSYQWDGEEVKLILHGWDNKLKQYDDVQLPSNWEIGVTDEVHLSPTCAWALQRWPGAKCYGALADDITLETPGMLRRLEELAGDWYIAYLNDGAHCERLCTFPCSGAKLIHATGDLSFGGLLHNGTDVVWYALGIALRILQYAQNCKITHWHPAFGRGKWDETYALGQRGSLSSGKAYDKFMQEGFEALRRRLSDTLDAAHVTRFPNAPMFVE